MTRRSDIPSPPVEQCDSEVRRTLTKDYNVLYVVSPRKADAAVGRGSPRQRTTRDEKERKRRKAIEKNPNPSEELAREAPQSPREKEREGRVGGPSQN